MDPFYATSLRIININCYKEGLQITKGFFGPAGHVAPKKLDFFPMILPRKSGVWLDLSFGSHFFLLPWMSMFQNDFGS